jgi:two-component system CheB/CheR fusion protein
MCGHQEQLRDSVPPVVGIGASAGGLEALLELFAHLPGSPGFAFVILLHSTPGHEPLLANILSGRTPLPVSEARENEVVEADRVYIAPPDIQVGLFGDRLVFVKQANSDSTRPIDRLFRSLACELERRAVAVILSGTGTDGTAGIRTIKACGGTALVQTPDSALFDAMPRNALDLGCVDFILSPEKIAGELVRLGRESLFAPDGGQRPCIGEDDLATLFRVLQAACGIDFSHYKRSTIRRRLARRLVLNKLDTLAAYLGLLNENPAEAAALCQDFLIQVTGFFREPDIFEALAEEAFPRLTQNRSGANPVRVWVPGCSTGEEVYSIAIALLEFLRDRAPSVPLLLFGTDASAEAIERARVGLYPAKTAQLQVSPERLERFFTRIDGHYQINSTVRDLCVFAQHDVARDPPFSRIDLISCCNLLIYFDPVLQKRVAETFHYALKPGGLLVLGPSESIGQQLFSQMDKRRKIYARKNEPGRLLLDLSHISENLMPFDPVKAAPEAVRPRSPDAMQKEVDRLILTRYAPAGLVIDEFQNVVQFTGRVAPYLEPRPGPAGLELQGLVRPALQMAIASALCEAQATNAPVRREHLRMETDGAERLVNLDVAPLREPSGETAYFLVTFEDLSPKDGAGKSKGWFSGVLSGWRRDRSSESGDGEAPHRLRQEIEALQNQLRAAFEIYEHSREELKSTQEELLSAREEFQSTNEELETAKEELQAANEELITANEELRLRNVELSRAVAEVQEARDFAQAIVDSTQAALLVLDPELRVQCCNRAFSEVFGLACEAAEGRFLGDLGEGAWNRPGLLDLLKGVAVEGNRVEHFEVALQFPRLGERVLVFNARKLEGEAELSSLVLLSMLDVTARRRAEARIKQQAELLDQAHEAILIWTFGGSIRYWNRGAEELYGWTCDEALGRVSHDLLRTRRSISPEEFDRRLREDRQWIGEVFQTTRNGRELVVDSRYTVEEQMDGSLLVLETNRDITRRKQAEESLRRADRQKDEFLAMLAHELRNPLAPLRNALGIMQRANPNQVSMEEIWAMMDRQVTKLSRIVDDLLDIARITRGQIELRKEFVDLVRLAGHAAESIGPLLKASEHRLTLSLLDRPVIIEADPVRIEQIIENLLSNAVKYTPPGGLIEVTLEVTDGEAVLRVRDNGQGISPQALPNIFELFMQAEQSLDRRQGGLGIGLTLVRRLVELHGGRVEAESDGPGLGSRFTVRFPLAAGLENEEAAPDSDRSAGTSDGVRRVLVVDDNPDAANSTAMLVRACGHQVKLAYDATLALDIAARFKPDVVLLDIGLPDVDGYELARRLRALGGLGQAYLVAISGYGSREDRAASKSAGIDRHLVKPVGLDALENVLGRAGGQQEQPPSLP